MLDVHAPEHPVHSYRDFFLHLFTIGLLIALCLESAVEWRHHVHVGEEAEANIVGELKDNQHDLNDILKVIPQEEKSLTGAMAFLQAHAVGKPYDIKDISLGMSLFSARNASWQTATTTGAVAYMKYSQVKHFSEAYTLQAQYASLQERTLDSYLQLQSYIVGGLDPTKISAADSEKARGDLQQTMARLVAMEQIGAALQKTYAEALKGD